MNQGLDKNQNMYANAIVTIEKFMEGALDDKIKQEIRKKGLVAGICMAIPLWGVETIIYAFVLWSTYSTISKISGVPFRQNFTKNVLVGFVTNLVITFALGCALDFIPIAGWIGSFIVGYLSIQLSGMGYVKALKLAHGRKAKTDLNFRSGVNAIKNNVSIADAQNKFSQTLHKTSAANSFIESAKTKDVEGMKVAYKDFTKGEAIEDITSEEIVMNDIPEELPIAQEQKRMNSELASVQYESNTQTKPHSTKIDQLRELKSLLDDGILTQDEFDTEKAKILNN